jgi:hypothetical protein
LTDEANLIPEAAEGDLASLGLGSNYPTPPEERAYLDQGVESTEQAVEMDVPPEQSMPTEVAPEPEPAAEAPAEEQTEQSLIDQYRSSFEQPAAAEPEPESEVSRLRQQVARMEGELRARNEYLDKAIAGNQQQPEAAKPETHEAFDPAVQAMLNRIKEEAPEKYESAVAMVASEIAEKRVESQIRELGQKIEAAQQQTQTDNQTLQFRQQFHTGLETAKEKLGGVYAEVVEDYAKNKENSLLFRKLTDNPYLLTSPEDAVKAVGADIQLWKQVGGNPAPVKQEVTEGSSSTAVAGGASERGISLNEPKPEGKSDAELVFDAVSTAKTPSLPWDE